MSKLELTLVEFSECGPEGDVVGSVWINPAHVSSVSRCSDEVSWVSMSNGRGYMVKGSAEYVACSLMRGYR